MKVAFNLALSALLVTNAWNQVFSQESSTLTPGMTNARPKGAKSLDDIRAASQTNQNRIGPSVGGPGPGVMSASGMSEAGGGGYSSGGMGPGGMGMGMPGGMSGMDETGGVQDGEKQMLIQLIEQLRGRLKSKTHNRVEVEKMLRSVLADYFMLDLAERVKELDKVKARVVEMETKLQRRLDSEQEIIQLQALQMLHKADGLEFSIPSGGGDFGGGSMESGGGMGMGMAGYGGEGSTGMSSFNGGGMGMGTVGYGVSAVEAIETKIGYDIGLGVTKYLRTDSKTSDPLDPLTSYRTMKPAQPIDSNTDEAKMKSIMSAMHQFERIFHHLPCSANRLIKGQPPHSWRIALLPLLGHASLYSQYRFDESWDSPNNSKLIAQMPAVFAATSGDGTKNAYFMMVGEGAAFTTGRPTTFADITDGSSNTIGIVKANRDIPWTKPEDIAYTIDGILPEDLAPNQFLIGLLDGVVVKGPKKLKARDFHALITRSGGETVPSNELLGER